MISIAIYIYDRRAITVEILTDLAFEVHSMPVSYSLLLLSSLSYRSSSFALPLVAHAQLLFFFASAPHVALHSPLTCLSQAHSSILLFRLHHLFHTLLTQRSISDIERSRSSVIIVKSQKVCH